MAVTPRGVAELSGERAPLWKNLFSLQWKVQGIAEPAYNGHDGDEEKDSERIKGLQPLGKVKTTGFKIFQTKAKTETAMRRMEKRILMVTALLRIPESLMKQRRDLRILPEPRLFFRSLSISTLLI